MAFEGDLSHLALGDVLQTLAMSRQTGTFILRGTSEERRLVFGPRGAGLLTVRQAMRDRVGDYLRGKGKVTPEVFEQAVKQARRKKEAAVEEVLREHGLVADADIAEARRYVAAEEIYDLFLWTQGQFEFQSSETPDQVPFGGAWFDIASIAMEAARRMDEVGRLRDCVPPTEVLCAAEDAPDPATLKLSADTLKVRELADGTRTVDGILAASHIGRFDTWKALETLREARMLRPARPEETAAIAGDLLRMKDHAGAAALLRRVLELNPDDDAARRDLVQALTLGGDKRAAAAEWIETALRADAAGDVAGALEGWRQAVRLDKDNAAAQDGYARILLATGDVAGGAEAARAATSLHIDARNFPAAVEIAHAAVNACPEDANVRIALANAHIAAGSPADALLLLDDAASLLETTAEDPRRLLDVYRRILQLDPARKDCSRRVQEIESSERFRRRRLVQRLAIVGGVLVAAAAAIPAFRGPDFDARVEIACAAIEEAKDDPEKVREATRLVEALEADAQDDEDRVLRVQSIRKRLENQTPKTRAVEAGKRLAEGVRHVLDAAFAAQGREHGWTEALRHYDSAVDLLESPDAKTVAAGDLDQLEALRKDVVDDVKAAFGLLQTEATRDSTAVTATRDKFVPEVFKKKDKDVLADLVERAEKVATIRAAQDWAAVAKAVGALQSRLASRLKDGTDRHIVEAVRAMVDAFPTVETEGARALGTKREIELVEKHRETYAKGYQLLGSGKVEEAQTLFREMLEACDAVRRYEPREIYDPIVERTIVGLDLERHHKEYLGHIEQILRDEHDAGGAIERGDVNGAFTIRRELHRKHRYVDFRERFKLPIRFESRPTGAAVVLLDGSADGEALGKTPLVYEYRLDARPQFAIRLDGFEEQLVQRRDALEDDAGVVQVELPKKCVFMVAGVGNVQAAPLAWEDRIVLGGRDGRVRLHSARDGAELATPFDTDSIEGLAGSAAVHGGRVFAATLDGAGFVLDGATLRKVREFRFDGRVRASLLATPRGVVAATEAGTATLLGDAGTVWSARVGEVRVDPVLCGSRVLFVTGRELVSLDLATGRDEVRVALPGNENAWGAPAADGDRVWLVGDNGLVACVHVAERRVLWQKALDTSVKARPALADGRLVVGTANGWLWALDPSNGTALAKDPLGGPIAHPPVALPSGWVVTTRAHKDAAGKETRAVVQRFDATGALVWRYESKEDLVSPAVLAGGRIVLVTSRGVLVSLRP